MAFWVIHSHAILVNIAQQLSSDILPTRLFVVEDARRRREHDDPNATRGQQIIDPLLDTVVLHIESRRNNSRFIQPSVELYDNFSTTMVINDFEFTDVT